MAEQSELIEINKKINNLIERVNKLENIHNQHSSVKDKSISKSDELPTQEELNNYKINKTDYLIISARNINWIRKSKYKDMFHNRHYDELRGAYTKKFDENENYTIINEHRPAELSNAVRNLVNENKYLMNEKDSIKKGEFILFINSLFNKSIPLPEI